MFHETYSPGVIPVFLRTMKKLELVTLKPFKRGKQNKKQNKKKSKLGSNQVGYISKLENLPISYAYKMKNKAPKYQTGKEGSVIISHNEYLLDVDAKLFSFSAAKVAINPGISTSFPWLSKIARSFESYRFKHLCFHFKPSCDTGVKGTIMMVSDPDPSDDIPENKTDFLNRKGASSGNVYKYQKYEPIRSDFNLEKSYYVRLTAPKQNQDIKLLDSCSFFIGYNGIDATGASGSLTIGEIHVSYTVELLVPTLELGRDLVDGYETWIANATSGVVAGAPFGTNLASRILGKFVSAGMYQFTEGSLGNFFKSNKTIQKIFNSVISYSITSGTPTGQGLVYAIKKYIGPTNNTFDSEEQVTFIDEDTDLVALYISDSSVFEDITSSAVVLGVTTTSTTNVQQTASVSLDPSDVLLVTWNVGTGGVTAPTALPQLIVTDKIFAVNPF